MQLNHWHDICSIAIYDVACGAHKTRRLRARRLMGGGFSLHLRSSSDFKALVIEITKVELLSISNYFHIFSRFPKLHELQPLR